MIDKLIQRPSIWEHVTEVSHQPIHTIHVITEKSLPSTASALAYQILLNKLPNSHAYLWAWKTIAQLHLSPSTSCYILSFLNELPNSLCLISEIIQELGTGTRCSISNFPITF